MESSNGDYVLNSKTSIYLDLKIPHTEPKTPFINLISNSPFLKPDHKGVPEKFKMVLLLNRSLFLKPEFAKESLRIIETCYRNFSTLLDGGRVKIRPMKFFPALREIDALIFELGSILDFFSREVNILFDLGIDLNKVDFSRVIRACQKKQSNEPITKALDKFITSNFYRYFKGMRNRITHRLPFVVRGKSDQIFFPDNPESDDADPSVENEIDVLETCRKWLLEILRFVDQTSTIVMPKMGRITAYDKKTGNKVDIEKRFWKK